MPVSLVTRAGHVKVLFVSPSTPPAPKAPSTRSYGGRTAEQRVAERRRRLVDATAAVLAAQGEAHITMTQVCQAAGLTERYFYESFAHLDVALLATLDSVCEEIMAIALTTSEETRDTPHLRVHAVMRAFVDWVVAHPDKAKVAVIHSSGNPQLRARRHELIELFAALVSDQAPELYGDQAWPPERTRVHGLVYVAGFAELVASWLSGDVTLSPDELVETAESLFEGVVRRPGPLA